MSRRASRGERWAATLPPSRPFNPHMRRFVPSTEFARSWFKDFAELLNPRHPSTVQLADMDDDEVGLSEERRATVEKASAGSKANYLIKDCKTGEQYFVKQSLNLDRFKREWLASQKFREYRIPSVLTASYWFECQDEKSDTQNAGFIVFPFLHCWTLREITCNKTLEREVSTQEWLLGLVSITEVFALTDPDSDDVDLHFHHGDLHADQIVFDHRHRRWYLIDFGNAKLSFEERIGNTPARWVDLDVIPGSSYVLPADQEFARIRSLFKVGLKCIWRRVEDACKAGTRAEVLAALQSLYVELHGPLPDLRPPEDEETRVNLIGGVSRLNAAPGLSYVEAARLERQRAEERARRNYRGFMAQVSELVAGSGPSPKRAAAMRSPTMAVPEAPRMTSPRKDTPRMTSPRKNRAQSTPRRKLKFSSDEEDKPAKRVATPQRVADSKPQDNESEDVIIISPPPSPREAPSASPVSRAIADILAAPMAATEQPVTITPQEQKQPEIEVVDLASDDASFEDVVSPAPGSDASVPILVADNTESHSRTSRVPPSVSAPSSQEKPQSSPPKALPPRDPSPEVIAIEVESASVTDQTSSTPARTARAHTAPPASPSISFSNTSHKSPKRSQAQRLEEEARMWARRQERRAASAGASGNSPPSSSSHQLDTVMAPPKTKVRREIVSEAERVAQEALAWKRRLERKTTAE